MDYQSEIFAETNNCNLKEPDLSGLHICYKHLLIPSRLFYTDCYYNIKSHYSLFQLNKIVSS